jgi:hypothetical protein
MTDKGGAPTKRAGNTSAMVIAEPGAIVLWIRQARRAPVIARIVFIIRTLRRSALLASKDRSQWFCSSRDHPAGDAVAT